MEDILQEENVQNIVIFQNLEYGIEFFGFRESMNTLVDLFCVRLGEGESANISSLPSHRTHHVRKYLLRLSTTCDSGSSPPEPIGHSAFHLQDVAHWPELAGTVRGFKK